MDAAYLVLLVVVVGLTYGFIKLCGSLEDR